MEVHRRAQRASFVEMMGVAGVRLLFSRVNEGVAAAFSRAREDFEKKKMEEATEELLGK